MKQYVTSMSLGAALLLAPNLIALEIDVDKNANVIHFEEETVASWTQNGSFKVEDPGTIEVLVVGGGGGGGAINTANTQPGSGGGGGGGVVHKKEYQVSVGTYNIEIGAGGAIGKNGANTTLLLNGNGITAYGGGAGSASESPWGGINGASGGGAANNTGVDAGGKAIYQDSDNLGFNGGGSQHIYSGGGGGGAGGPGETSSGSSAANGGIGYLCNITGTDTYYAGGGGGYRYSTPTVGGLGGGGAGGVAGAANTGGGGGGNASGGSGIVIIRFKRDYVKPTEDFWVSGGEQSATTEDVLSIFRENATLQVTGKGVVDLLLVGGGGGGGANNVASRCGGAGGGAGGFIYLKNMPVKEGTYEVTVGQGGAVGENGGNTTFSALNLIAYGGGYGASALSYSPGGDGASGGGGATYKVDVSIDGGKAIYPNNNGNNGGSSINPYGAGGGGGAGSAGESTGSSTPGRGGDGLACSITGKEVYYAGGGAGYRDTIPTVGGLGGGGAGGVAGAVNTGGGGGGGAAGGSGILIMRYKKTNHYKEKVIDCEGGELKYSKGYNTHVFTENGTFVVPENGIFEVLVVGGGGGGGKGNDADLKRGGGGGGAGGVIHKRDVVLLSGTYEINIGEGGAVGENGKNTQAFELVAYGGGHGGWYDGVKAPGDGASGGGRAVANGGTGNGGKAIYGDENNLGNNGGGSVHLYGAGGGGGAGGEGQTPAAPTGSTPGNGGIGYLCNITGTDTYYAGGGAGYRSGSSTVGGLGGGGAGGVAGAANTGGGGGGNASGGSGIVIIRYYRGEKGLILTVR